MDENNGELLKIVEQEVDHANKNIGCIKKKIDTLTADEIQNFSQILKGSHKSALGLLGIISYGTEEPCPPLVYILGRKLGYIKQVIDLLDKILENLRRKKEHEEQVEKISRDLQPHLDNEEAEVIAKRVYIHMNIRVLRNQIQREEKEYRVLEKDLSKLLSHGETSKTA